MKKSKIISIIGSLSLLFSVSSCKTDAHKEDNSSSSNSISESTSSSSSNPTPVIDEFTTTKDSFVYDYRDDNFKPVKDRSNAKYASILGLKNPLKYKTIIIPDEYDGLKVSLINYDFIKYGLELEGYTKDDFKNLKITYESLWLNKWYKKIFRYSEEYVLDLPLISNFVFLALYIIYWKKNLI